MLHMKVLVVHEAQQAALPCHVLAPVDAGGYPVHPIRRLFKRRQVHAKWDTRPMLVRVVGVTQLGRVLNVTCASDVPQASTAPGTLKTRAVAARGRPRLLLLLLKGNLPGRSLGASRAPDGTAQNRSASKETLRSAVYWVVENCCAAPRRPPQTGRAVPNSRLWLKSSPGSDAPPRGPCT